MSRSSCFDTMLASLFAPAAECDPPLGMRGLVDLAIDWIKRAFVCRASVTAVASRDAPSPSLWVSSSSEGISTQPVHLGLVLDSDFLIAMPFFKGLGLGFGGRCSLVARRFKWSLELLPAFFLGLGNRDVAASGPFPGSLESFVNARLQLGQSQWSGSSSVTRTHCQWYHLTGHLSLSQQIQSSDVSGTPQAHL